MNFNELNLNPKLLRAIADRGYTELTSVQEQTLAKTLSGADVAVQSQTGTGKTAAFLITLLERMLNESGPQRRKALVIVPTRELAVQIEGEARLLNRHLGYSIACFYGGVGYAGQLANLKKGVDIVIGTPGRLLDLSERGLLKLKETGFLVIDEADRLFDMGFLPDIKRLLQRIPERHLRQSMLFSATLNRVSRKIAGEYLNNPTFIQVTPEQLTVDTITQELYRVKSHLKLNLLLGILQNDAPRNALIFTNMRHTSFRLAKKLAVNGYQAMYLAGDLPQSSRLKIVNDFAAGKFSFLVATDVAARGLHIEGLEMVVNYDLPQDFENYVHRIGRTARAGNSGKAISLASEGTDGHLEAIESFIKMKIPVRAVTDGLFATDNSQENQGRNWSRTRPAEKPRFGHGGPRRASRPRMSGHVQPSPA